MAKNDLKKLISASQISIFLSLLMFVIVDLIFEGLFGHKMQFKVVLVSGEFVVATFHYF